MSTAERLRRLEDEMEYVKAIIDGSEAQTREAFTVVVGLLVAFLKGKGTLGYEELISFLAAASDPDYGTEDHSGRLIHETRWIVEFHKGLEAGTLKLRRAAQEPPVGRGDRGNQDTCGGRGGFRESRVGRSAGTQAQEEAVRGAPSMTRGSS